MYCTQKDFENNIWFCCMNYEEAVNWVDGFHQFGVQLGLDRILKILDILENPHYQTRFVHVAGTNGKGSVCRYISSILTSEGYKTGLYLSPHLVNFRERIQLNNDFISKDHFVKIVEHIQPIVNDFVKNQGQLTYFEVCTIIAFVFFNNEHVDYAIIEVGLGGRYDATNVIDPLVSVITNVSLDHQHLLGNTIQKIATEKAGIIKHKKPVVTGATDDALSVLHQKCKQEKCSLHIVSIDNVQVLQNDYFNQTILFHGLFDDYEVSTRLIGCYQPINIAVSIATIEILQQQGVFIRKESIVEGIRKMKHPGRMQILRKNPVVVVDGAHNPDAVKHVVKSIKLLFSYDRLILIFGVMKDKAIKEMLLNLLPIADLVIVTEPKQDRTAKSLELADLIANIDNSKRIIQTTSVNDAYKKAIKIATESDLILATGSLFTVAELLVQSNEK